MGRRRFGVDLDAAMRYFGTHLSVQSTVRATLAAVDYDLIWVPPSKTYIAVRWRGEAAAWVHHGHIGIPGGQRVELPGYRGTTRSRVAGTPPRRGALCPDCRHEMPLTGVCDMCA